MLTTVISTMVGALLGLAILYKLGGGMLLFPFKRRIYIWWLDEIVSDYREVSPWVGGNLIGERFILKEDGTILGKKYATHWAYNIKDLNCK